MKYKTVNELVCKTSSPIFKAYWKELRRHENALRRIYAGDKLHKHVVEEIGRINQVEPCVRHIVTFFRCAICMKDLTQREVETIRKALR